MSKTGCCSASDAGLLSEFPLVSGRLTESAANGLDLTPGIPVVGGGADQAAQALAMGITKPGILGLTIGTSGVIVMTRSAPCTGFILPCGRSTLATIRFHAFSWSFS